MGRVSSESAFVITVLNPDYLFDHRDGIYTRGGWFSPILRTAKQIQREPTMKVQLLVTKNDFNLSNLENEFRNLGIAYQVDFVEEHPEMVSALNIRHSPNIIVDDELVFQRLPSESELKAYFSGRS
jgi:hypothetical protein